MKTAKALFGILTITLALPAQGQTPTSLTNGLLAYYPFNGNANDASGNGNDGMVSGATLTNDRFGIANSAYYFNGTNSWITMPQTLLLDGASNATISAWLVIKSGTSGEFLSTGDSRGGLDPIHLSVAPQNANHLALQNTTLGNVPNAFIGDNLAGQTLTNFTADTWHQFVLVLSTKNPLGQLTVYVDGVAEAVQVGADDGSAFTEITYDRGMPVLIGGITYSYGPGELWTGDIDDIRIYNRDLSTDEVAQLYASESAPPIANYFSTTDANMWQIAGGGATNVTPYEISPIGSISIKITEDTYVAGVTDFTGFWLADYVVYVPYGAINVSLTYSNFYVDDRGLLLLNGNPIVATGTTAPADGEFVFSDGGSPQAYSSFVGPDGSVSGSVTSGISTGGYNDLRVIINNTGTGDAGSDIAGGDTYLTLWGAVSYELPCLPHTATASAVVTNGFVIAATITDGGCGYTNTPTVRIIGGDGSGAQAVAVVSNGVVIAIEVLDAGSDYTNTPLVIIEPPFIPNPVLGIAPMSFLSFTNLAVGGAYQLQQAIAWYWTNQPLSFTATNAIYTQMVAGVVGSGDFRLAINPVPSQAFATPEVVNGFVVGVTVTSGGTGYATSPAVSIVGGGGTNATAVSQISGGVVTNISITDAGIGYTNTPTVEIAPPPAAAVFPTVMPVMRLDSTNLAPYDNYQVQFTPTIGETWGNWNGGLFSPTDVTNSQYLFITNGIGYFRLQYVP